MSLVESIKYFESVHSDMLNEDRTLTPKGYDTLHDYEANWSEDPKWSDYFCFHLRSRLDEYWFGDSCEQDDNDYYLAWQELHPKLDKTTKWLRDHDHIVIP